MTERLREELRRLGDEAPDLDIPRETWARGRRARNRDRAVTGLLVASLVAIAGALIQITPASRLATEVLASTPRDAAPALPDRLYAVPERFVQLRETSTGEVTWDPRVAVTDLAVGPAIAAFTAGDFGKLPVVITAGDRCYRPLVLPGFSDASRLNSTTSGSKGGGAMSLSPDGRSLAYAWWDPAAPLDAPMPAGVRIVDLTTGEVRSLELQGGNGVDVDLLSWSPNGDWLAWAGMVTKSWTPSSRSGFDAVAGRITATDLTNETIPGITNQEWGVGVSDAGEVTLWSGQSLQTWDGARLRGHSVPGARGVGEGGPVTVASADGLVAMTSYSERQPLRVAHVSGGRVTYQGGVKTRTPGASLEAVGWLDDGQVLTLERPPRLDDEATLGATEVDPVQANQPTAISSVEQGVTNLSVATELIDPANPVVSYPPPAWPWSTERKLLVAGLVLAALILGATLLVRRRLTSDASLTTGSDS